MTSLVACLSTGKGTWNHVAQLMKGQPWDNVFLITNDFGKQNFNKTAANVFMVIVDPELPVNELAEVICKQLQDKIRDYEVALNIVSGTGKEHMAIISALLKLGLGMRFVVPTEKGVEEV